MTTCLGPAALACLALLASATAAARPPDDPPRTPRPATRPTAAPKPAPAPAPAPGPDRAAVQAAEAEERRLAALRVESAARLRATEQEVADRAAETAALASRRDAAAAALAARAAQLAPLLPLMQRLALFPAETLLAIPAPTEDALRGLDVLRGMARTLEVQAAGLRQQQAALERDQRALEASLPPLQAARIAQAAEDRELDSMLAAAQATRQRTNEAVRRTEAEAARAETLRAAVTAVEAARARAEAEAAADVARAERRQQDATAAEARRRQEALAATPGAGPEPRGQLAQPVAGAVTRAWAAPTEAGPANGVSFRTAPQARVVAPCGGRVRFAGPFRSFGVLIILDCGGNTASVLAGMARSSVTAGTAVLQGEPVGVMPDWNPAAPGPHPALYMELRRDGQAVDPAPYLRARG